MRNYEKTKADSTRIGTAPLLRNFYKGERDEIEWLRKLRNRYVHLNLSEPCLEMDTWFQSQAELEADTTRTIKIAIKAFLQNLGT